VFLGASLLNEYGRVHPMIGELRESIARGELHVEIDRTFPLSEATKAHEFAESRQAFGRVVMTP
jgi:NADPH:quinone reductase